MRACWFAAAAGMTVAALAIPGQRHASYDSFLGTAPDSIGFVGFGEAAYHLAKGLKGAGIRDTFAYDIKRHPQMESRAAETGTHLCASNAELAAATGIIISAVTADQAVPAAEQTAPHLTDRHLYADLNSVSPRAKERAAEAVWRNRARFVEIAVMGPIPPYGHQAPLLIGGAAAPEFQRTFEPLGMRMEIVSTDQIGRAAAVKMFRSVIYKGLEALILECVLGASQYGAEPRVFASLAESLPGIDWKKLADYMVGRVAIHGERRAREMEEVARTLQELGIEPLMATATARRFDWAASLGLREVFGGEFPKTYEEVVAQALDLGRTAVHATTGSVTPARSNSSTAPASTGIEK
jgi:3-hydroxyisobutyrate dehydrogenase-like beta-hydroxyacid dehydrogenase